MGEMGGVLWGRGVCEGKSGRKRGSVGEMGVLGGERGAWGGERGVL